MKIPKVKSVAPARMRDGSNAMKRPRPARPYAIYRPEEVEEIFRRLAVQRPEPKSELDFSSPFTLLCAVVLSAQATDAGVNRATRGLFAAADTPDKMIALGEGKIGELIRSIGLWRGKAKNLAALSQALIRDHHGAVPETREELTALPGVGRKTANVVLNSAFGQPTMAVDTHIFRLGNRLRLAPGNTPEKVEAGLVRIIPPEYMRHAHHWLILHGRYVCKARRPECGHCIIADLCKSPEKTSALAAPLTAIPDDAIPADAIPANG